MKEYNPIGCDHKKDNGFSAWDIQSGEIGSGPEMDVDVHVMVCKKCGDIRVVGRRWDGKKDKADHFDEIFHVYHEDAIDAIIKQANFFNEEVKWQRVPATPASIENEAKALYPYPKELLSAEWRTDEIIDRERSAHITAARQYMGEVERLKDVLHIDQTGLAKGLAQVNKIVEGYRWVTEGRGPYEWNDDKYKEEMGNMLDNISEAATKALNSSGAIAHSVCCDKEGRTATMEGIGYIKKDAHDMEVERLKTLIKNLYDTEVSEPCKNAGASDDLIESHWQEFKEKHNL